MEYNCGFVPLGNPGMENQPLLHNNGKVRKSMLKVLFIYIFFNLALISGKLLINFQFHLFFCVRKR